MGFIWVLRFHGGEEVAIDEALPQRSTEDWGQRPGCERMGPTGQDFGTSKHRWVCESLWLELNTGGNSFGVPIIAMPMHLDQPLNAKLRVEICVGM